MLLIAKYSVVRFIQSLWKPRHKTDFMADYTIQQLNSDKKLQYLWPQNCTY